MKVTGIDKDKEKIDFARKKFKRKNLKFIVSQKISGKFDLIFCVKTTHYLNMKKYPKEFFKHLNLNGFILAFDYRKVSKKKAKKVWNQRDKEFKKIGLQMKPFEKWYKKHNLWSSNQFKKIFEKAGFKTVKLKEENVDALYIGKKLRS